MQRIFSTTTETENWRDTILVAEIAVEKAEKGDRIQPGDVAYGRFWNKEWIGKRDPDPHASGHSGTAKGATVRAYLSLRKGAYCVLLPNGFEELKKPPKSNVAQAIAAKELAEVQGKWVRTMRTDSGTFKVVKEHRGSKTTVTILDWEGNVVTAKKSEFRLEQTGKVRIFTFFNNVITAGPQKGQTDEAPHSYIYRVTGDTFVEVNGLLIGDDAEPVAFTWKRVKE